MPPDDCVRADLYLGFGFCYARPEGGQCQKSTPVQVTVNLLWVLVPHLRLHSFSLKCKGALGCILRMLESVVRLNSAQNSSGSSLWIDLKKPCCQIAGRFSTSLVRSKLSKQVFGMFSYSA